MRSLSLALLLGAMPVMSLLHSREWYEARFVDWMSENNVDFSDGEEFVKRLDIWAEADDLIVEHNSGNHTYTLGHNSFSHLTSEEWQERMGMGRLRLNPVKRGVPQRGFHSKGKLGAVRLDLAEEIDWVTKGAMTPVKNQGQCGSCWSFSTTGALEGAFYIKYGKAKNFSEEQLVSCDTNDHGCNGGFMDNAFEWIRDNGGICSEESWPYDAEVDACRKCVNVPGTALKTWTDVDQSDLGLMAALNKGPVSVAIQANQKGFQLYKSGVFTGRCGTSLDHGVVAVGYGTEDNVDYYKIRNSWGEDWGEEGYIRVARGIDQEGGQCGILMAASQPNL